MFTMRMKKPIYQSTDDLHFFDRRWPILYADNHLLVVYKPSGLLVQGDHTGDISLLDLGKRWIKTRYHKPGRVFLAMVHRLDRPVAGVVLFARTTKAAGRLARQFRERTVQKHYLAVVHGRVPKHSARLNHHIVRNQRQSRIVPAPTMNSQEARLNYTVLDRSEHKSLLQVKLETGRRHQIRIQLAHVGHPILGDLRYGAGEPLWQKQIALLAHILSVDHPTQETRLTIQSPLPVGWPWPTEKSAARRTAPWDWRVFEEAVRCVARLTDD